MGELFEHTTVKTVMDKIGEDFSLLSDAIKETNELITTALGSPDKSVYGDAGNKILATWDENCSTLNSFMSIYDSWSTMAVSIAKEFAEFDKGVAVVGDNDAKALKTIADLNKTNWLKTSDGRKNYVGSTVSYIDPETQKEVEEKVGFKQFNSTGGGKSSSEGGDWRIVTEKDGKIYGTDGKEFSDEDLTKSKEKKEKLSEAQKALKSSVDVKHKELEQRDEEREKKRVEASEWAIGSENSILHMNQKSSNSGYAERQKRIEFLGGMKNSDSAQRAMMTTINVPIWDGSKETTLPLTVNKKLVDNYQKAFREVCDLKFPVKTNPSQNAFCAYAWNHFRPGGERSDHAYGGTFDINTVDNSGSGNGSQYAVRTRPDVIAAFEKQGFFWGGNWESSKDDMHFSFTGY